MLCMMNTREHNNVNYLKVGNGEAAIVSLLGGEVTEITGDSHIDQRGRVYLNVKVSHCVGL